VATAAHSINEDVADALLTASRHINEGVAVTLHDASNHINETNATMFAHAADRLASLDVVGMSATADQVADTFASLAAVVEELNQATYAVHRAAAPFLRFTVSLRAAAMIFVVGVITGAVAYAHFAGR
jgi:hypothetical protein